MSERAFSLHVQICAVIQVATSRVLSPFNSKNTFNLGEMVSRNSTWYLFRLLFNKQ